MPGMRSPYGKITTIAATNAGPYFMIMIRIDNCQTIIMLTEGNWFCLPVAFMVMIVKRSDKKNRMECIMELHHEYHFPLLFVVNCLMYLKECAKGQRYQILLGHNGLCLIIL